MVTVAIDTIAAIIVTPMLFIAMVAYRGGDTVLSFLRKQRNNIWGSIPVGDRSITLDILLDPPGLAIRNQHGESVVVSPDNIMHLAGLLTIAGDDLKGLLESRGILWG